MAAYNGIGIDKGMKVPVYVFGPWWETEGERLAWLVTEGVAGACWAPSNYKIDGALVHTHDRYPMGKNSEELTLVLKLEGILLEMMLF